MNLIVLNGLMIKVYMKRRTHLFGFISFSRVYIERDIGLSVDYLYDRP